MFSVNIKSVGSLIFQKIVQEEPSSTLLLTELD